MDREQAKNLIIQTFENSFNREKFTKFIANFLKEYDSEKSIPPRYGIQGVTTPFLNFIEEWERLGVYETDGKRIDILIVKLKKDISVFRARSTQRNFVAQYLQGKLGTTSDKDAALVAFVSPNEEDWRFSLVKMEYQLTRTSAGRVKAEELFTPARRWSFLVGKSEKSHTAQSRFLPILERDFECPTLELLEDTFNVEVVTKEFFRKYRNLFLLTKLYLDRIILQDEKVRNEFEHKNINSVDFVKKLLGQIVFLYFLQKKGWFGVEKGARWGTGHKDFIRRLFNKEFCDYENFFNDILEPLFYEALRTDRSSADHYYSRFDCRLPFLNGGLFDPINNYDWVNTKILLPNELFSNNKRTSEGDIGDGILDVFDRFNFTVNEEEPLEKEVALDPELLGKIYEQLNAIRADNFDKYLDIITNGRQGEETEFNREYGVYYTPREIVDFMCRESLINYLYSELNGKVPKPDIEELLDNADLLREYEEVAKDKEEKINSGEQKTTKFKNKLPDIIISYADKIDNLLVNIRICDPAIGSGAFPIGMLHQIVKLRSFLSVYLDKDLSTYELKRQCIENCLYGVDIDPGAVEICKLRFWLSMIVDEEDFYQIKPLPNLDYKIVCGDSLLRVERDLYNQENFEKLEKLKNLHFNETNPNNKQQLKNSINEVISEITKGHSEFDFQVYFSEVFNKKNGFDIVIGNPPYIQLQRNKGELANKYNNLQFETFDRSGDIYCLFYEKGIDILKESGHLCFITSNKWMRSGYGEKVRKFFIKHNPKILIDLGPDVFESATVDTNIIIIQKLGRANLTETKQLKGLTLKRIGNKALNIIEQFKNNAVLIKNLSEKPWFIGSEAEQRLKEKIEKIGKPLKEWDVKIYRGVLTGLNEAFIITTEKRNEILNNCKDDEERKRTEAIIKPILRGRDIKRYYYEWAGLWVIGTFPALHLNIEEYPSLKKYFHDNFDNRQLEQSGLKYPSLGFNARKKTGNKWFETQDQIAYYHEFEKEKVVWGNISYDSEFCFVDKGIYINAPANILTSGKTSIKYLIANMNSRIFDWQFKQVGIFLGYAFEWKKQYIEQVKIPPITSFNNTIAKEIDSLVDKILAAKKQNPQADTSNLEREIDRLVYALYDLTAEEIKIIEKEN